MFTQTLICSYVLHCAYLKTNTKSDTRSPEQKPPERQNGHLKAAHKDADVNGEDPFAFVVDSAEPEPPPFTEPPVTTTK